VNISQSDELEEGVRNLGYLYLRNLFRYCFI